MTARTLSHVAVLGAAVIVVVSFALSAGAVVDFATDVGVDRRLAVALPVCVEALMVVAGAVMVARRIDAKADRSRLAVTMFYAAVAVTFAVNWAHGAAGAASPPVWVAPFLSAVPALSLPASLHLALEEWLRVRHQPARRRARSGGAKKPAVRGSSAAEVKGSLALERSNGDGPRKLTLAELRGRYDSVALERLYAEHDGSWSAVAKAIPVNRSALNRYRDELEKEQP